ncbi:TolC family protein [Silanimonas sp.]|uniref:TolC family protein n=1 Tax=Silanimonas sp. TaxID=1929290 RepID=UPI001BC63872|nr:TolC family protein [Silanimonas sp.]MBS3895844.1 TolC family protein [Silanimonas sp.]MBS3924851.1 TolC family protein [Xanthomonadaceae bacterium]
MCVPNWTGRLALALMLLCLPSAAAANERMTAAEAVDRALTGESWPREWQARVELAQADRVLARARPNPSLVASRETLAEPGLASGDETSLMLVQGFELGGRRAAGIRAAEAGLQVAEVQAIRDRRQLRAETLRAYYATVASEQIAAARARALADLEHLAGIAQKRHAEGEISGYEARRFRQAAGQARIALAETEAETRMRRAALVAWVGPTAALAVLDDSIPLPSLTEDHRPGSAELDVLAAEQTQAEAQLQSVSRLPLPLTVGVGQRRVRLGGFSDAALVLEVAVDLPLFDRQQGERARARAALSLAEARREREQQQLQQGRTALMAQARTRIDSAERIATVLLPEAAQLSAIAKQSFSEGELDLVALLDAFDSESALVEQGVAERLAAVEAALALEALAPLVEPLPRVQH